MQPSQGCDPFFVSDITESLFENLLKVPNDLPARNIQRGKENLNNAIFYSILYLNEVLEKEKFSGFV